MKERLRLLAKESPETMVTIRFRAYDITNERIAYDHNAVVRAEDAEDFIEASENTWPVYCRDILLNGNYL